jgi:hypothetical protein
VGALGTYSTLQKITSAKKRNPGNKQHHHRKSSEQRGTSRDLARTWHVEHLLLLSNKFNVHERYKIIAFADLLLLTRGKSVSEVENIGNIELKMSQGGQKKTRSVSTTKIKSNVDDTSQKVRKKGRGNIFQQQTPQTI